MAELENENAFVSAVESGTKPSAPESGSTDNVNNEETQGLDLSAENTLTGIAIFTLVAGIIATIICLFTICFIQNPKYTYLDEKIFSPEGFATTVTILMASLATWALLKVIANISITLKKINQKIK